MTTSIKLTRIIHNWYVCENILLQLIVAWRTYILIIRTNYIQQFTAVSPESIVFTYLSCITICILSAIQLQKFKKGAQRYYAIIMMFTASALTSLFLYMNFENMVGYRKKGDILRIGPDGLYEFASEISLVFILIFWIAPIIIEIIKYERRSSAAR